jgi:hypothetical protein
MSGHGMFTSHAWQDRMSRSGDCSVAARLDMPAGQIQADDLVIGAQRGSVQRLARARLRPSTHHKLIMICHYCCP